MYTYAHNTHKLSVILIVAGSELIHCKNEWSFWPILVISVLYLFELESPTGCSTFRAVNKLMVIFWNISVCGGGKLSLYTLITKELWGNQIGLNNIHADSLHASMQCIQRATMLCGEKYDLSWWYHNQKEEFRTHSTHLLIWAASHIREHQ